MNPDAATRLLDRIESYAERLPEYSFVGRPGRVPGTREGVVHPNYVVVYRIEAEVVRILNVIHARRRYPTNDAN